jgi:hypothetical protein
MIVVKSGALSRHLEESLIARSCINGRSFANDLHQTLGEGLGQIP